jgi:hypothetical protein
MIIVNGEINQMFVGTRAGLARGLPAAHLRQDCSLFAVASEAAAVLGEADEGAIMAMRAFGREVGMAFQIMDDILDFTGDESHLGKPVAVNLRQG